MSLSEMNFHRTICLLLLCLTVAPSFSMGSRSVNNRRPSRSDSKPVPERVEGRPHQARSVVWDAPSAEDAVPESEFHYLAMGRPPGVLVASKVENWRESANIAGSYHKILPNSSMDGASHSRTFAGFLAVLKATAEADKLRTLNEEEEEEPEMSASEAEPVEAEPVAEEPVFPLEEDEDLSHLESGFNSDTQAIFPRPHEQFVSGERLLMFFPVDHPSLDNWSASPALVPFETDVRFQPPSANLPRSTATYRKEE